MKFTATVGTRTLTNLEGLLRAFHYEGGRESRLEVKGMDVTMEVNFRQIPKRIINAMTLCKIKKFSYNDARLNSLVGATMKVQLLKENLGEANKIKLICGFFNEFDPDSSLVISNGEAIISKFIRPSIEIIKVAGLQYAFSSLSKAKEDFDEPEKEKAEEESLDESEREVKAEETSDESEQEAEEESFDESKQEETEEESYDQSEQEVEETSNQPKQDEKVKEEVFARHARHKNFYTIPEFDEIAKESTSYQEFVTSVIEKFELGKRPNLFANLIKAAEQIEIISWGNLQIAADDNGIEFNKSDKSWLTRQVRDKFRNIEGSAVTALRLINIIVGYKTYFICEKEEKTVFIKVELTEDPQTEKEIAKEEKTDHPKQDNVEEKSCDEPKQNAEVEKENSEQTKLKEAEEKNTEIEVVTQNTSKVKMECMPEIHQFEESLKSVDKTQTVEAISEHILKAMGLVETSSREQEYLIRIVSAALETDMDDFRVCEKENTSENRKALFEHICDKAEIPTKMHLYVQLTLSKFINNYVKIFYPNNKPIFALDFLKELNEILMS